VSLPETETSSSPELASSALRPRLLWAPAAPGCQSSSSELSPSETSSSVRCPAPAATAAAAPPLAPAAAAPPPPPRRAALPANASAISASQSRAVFLCRLGASPCTPARAAETSLSGRAAACRRRCRRGWSPCRLSPPAAPCPPAWPHPCLVMCFCAAVRRVTVNSLAVPMRAAAARKRQDPLSHL
jgi:hypothetical protein